MNTRNWTPILLSLVTLATVSGATPCTTPCTTPRPWVSTPSASAESWTCPVCDRTFTRQPGDERRLVGFDEKIRAHAASCPSEEQTWELIAGLIASIERDEAAFDRDAEDYGGLKSCENSK